MIISASRRTDIPAFYPAWFLNRLRAGEAWFPLRGNKVGHAALSPEWVDCIVFWTKNPLPLMGMLEEISRMGYAYYFQFTLTPYEMPMERGLSPAARIEAFCRLSDKLGPERVDWRYDPVILGGAYTVEYHLTRFQALCEKLWRYTTRCVFSFMDSYAHTGNLSGGSPAEMLLIAQGFSRIAKRYRLPLFTCGEEIDLSPYGIGHAACIDPQKIARITGWPMGGKKDPGQRRECGCMESVDIGAYDTCPGGCAYCYANANRPVQYRHDPRWPMLTGQLGTAPVLERTGPSLKIGQTSLF